MVTSPSGLSQRRFQKAFKSRKVDVAELEGRTPYQQTPKGKSELRWSYWTFVGCMSLGILGAAGLFV